MLNVSLRVYECAWFGTYNQHNNYDSFTTLKIK